MTTRVSILLFLLAIGCGADEPGSIGTGNGDPDASTNAGSGAGTHAGSGGTHAGSGGTHAGSSGMDADSGEAGSAGTSAGSGGASEDSGEPVANAMRVDLGSAGDFVILAKTGVSSVPTSMITGDVGVSPAAASYITGFSLSADATNVFATAPQVVGQVFAADYEPPTPSNMTTAVGDMEGAFSDAAGRAADVTELGAGDVGGMLLGPGVYAWGTGLLIPADLTLVGTATDVWIFQIAGDLTVSGGRSITLEGGAQAANIFWQVSGEVTLDTTAHLEGVVLSQTAITLRTGASIRGRLLAQTSIDLDSSLVTEPD